jgi:hypothetical protein
MIPLVLTGDWPSDNESPVLKFDRRRDKAEAPDRN